MSAMIATKIRRGIAGRGAALLAFATLLTSTGGVLSAQRYALEIDEEPYVPLVDATPLVMPWGPPPDNPNATLTPGSEIFRFMGENYAFTSSTGIGVSRYGNLQIDGAVSSVVVQTFVTFLDSIAADAQVRYRLEGERRDRVVKIEWHNVGFPGCSSEFGTSFQIWLFQKSGIIEMRYGETRDACNSAYNGGQNDGPGIGIAMMTPDFRTLLEVAWLSGDAADPEIVTNATPFLDGAPPPNTVYRFIPTDATAVEDEVGSAAVAVRVVPNPARDRAMLELTVNENEEGKVDLYDVLGRRVRTLLDERLEAGSHTVEVDLRGLAPGTYLAKGMLGRHEVSAPVIVP